MRLWKAGVFSVRDTKQGVRGLYQNRKYICFRADSYKICNSNIHLVEYFSKINPCSNGQRSCTVIPHENGGRETEQSFVSTEQRDVEWKMGSWLLQSIFQGQWMGSRHSVTKCDGFKRVEVKPSSISKNFVIGGEPQIWIFLHWLSHQVPADMSRELDPCSKDRGAFQI